MTTKQMQQQFLYLRTDLNCAEHALDDGDLRRCGQGLADVATNAGRLLRAGTEARAQADAARDAELDKGGKYGA